MGRHRWLLLSRAGRRGGGPCRSLLEAAPEVVTMAAPACVVAAQRPGGAGGRVVTAMALFHVERGLLRPGPSMKERLARKVVPAHMRQRPLITDVVRGHRRREGQLPPGAALHARCSSIIVGNPSSPCSSGPAFVQGRHAGHLDGNRPHMPPTAPQVAGRTRVDRRPLRAWQLRFLRPAGGGGIHPAPNEELPFVDHAGSPQRTVSPAKCCPDHPSAGRRRHAATG